MTTGTKQDLREVMVQSFIDTASAGVNITVAVSDSTSTAKIGPFQKQFPARVINVGIAEQDLVGVAAGLALGGCQSFTCNAAPFLVSRAAEQVKNDVCYSNTNVKLVGLNAGFTYGPLGSTHHAIDDVSAMRGYGNIMILAPSDPVTARAMFDFCATHQGPVYVRMDSAAFPTLHDSAYRFEPGKAVVLRPGSQITIVALGSVVHEAVDAAQLLAGRGIDAEVIDLCSVRPLDRAALVRSIVKTRRAVTVEEHSVNGGIGDIVASVIAEEGLCARLTKLGVADGIFPDAGPRAAMRRAAGIDAAGICAAAGAMI